MPCATSCVPDRMAPAASTDSLNARHGAKCSELGQVNGFRTDPMSSASFWQPGRATPHLFQLGPRTPRDHARFWSSTSRGLLPTRASRVAEDWPGRHVDWRDLRSRADHCRGCHVGGHRGRGPRPTCPQPLGWHQDHLNPGLRCRLARRPPGCPRHLQDHRSRESRHRSRHDHQRQR